MCRLPRSHVLTCRGRSQTRERRGGRPGPKNPLTQPSPMWSLGPDYPCSAPVSPDSRQPLLEGLLHHPDERVPVLLPNDKAGEDR
jgi:hypothetical protein